MAGEGDAHRRGRRGSLQRSLDEGGPDDGSVCGVTAAEAAGVGGDEVGAVSHVPVVLHDLLDDLVLLIVQHS